MKKIIVTLEMDYNEAEIKNMGKDSKAHKIKTDQEYIQGIDVYEADDAKGIIELYNDIERNYNENIGDSCALTNPTITSIEIK